MSDPKPKTIYRVRNWTQYNQALINRGSLTLWLSEDVIASWLNQTKTGHRGRSYTYADVAVECILLIRNVFALPLRQTQGLLQSIMLLVGLPLPVPNYSTLSRRQSGVPVKLSRKQKSGESLHVVVDSTGIKVFGHGEWFLRKYGSQHNHKPRKDPKQWRKIHLGLDEATQEVLAVLISERQRHDKTYLPDLLAQIEAPLTQVTADGGYDYISCYQAIAARQAAPVIPPRKSARITHAQGWAQRDAHVQRIREVGLQAWKQETNYHRRSLAETAMYRLQTIFGPKLHSRNFESQAVEVRLRCQALNRMTHLGLPEAYPVTVAA